MGSANPIIEELIVGNDREILIEPLRKPCGGREVVIEDIRAPGRDYVVELEAPLRRPCHKHRDVIVEEVRDLEIDLPRREIAEEVIIERKLPAPPCNKKPDVFVHKLSPIVVNSKPRHIVVEAGKPQVIRTQPVFIHRKGQVHYEAPRVVHHQQKPIYLTEKILKVSRPIHKKVFVEKYVKEEAAGAEEVVEKKLCQSSAREVERSQGYVERLDLGLGPRCRGALPLIEDLEVEVGRDGHVELDVELLGRRLPAELEIERLL